MPKTGHFGPILALIWAYRAQMGTIFVQQKKILWKEFLSFRGNLFVFNFSFERKIDCIRVVFLFSFGLNVIVKGLGVTPPNPV